MSHNPARGSVCENPSAPRSKAAPGPRREAPYPQGGSKSRHRSGIDRRGETDLPPAFFLQRILGGLCDEGL